MISAGSQLGQDPGHMDPRAHGPHFDFEMVSSMSPSDGDGSGSREGGDRGVQLEMRDLILLTFI